VRFKALDGASCHCARSHLRAHRQALSQARGGQRPDRARPVQATGPAIDVHFIAPCFELSKSVLNDGTALNGPAFSRLEEYKE
jgi:hypothetical protein